MMTGNNFQEQINSNLMPGASNNGWEDSPWSIITSKTSLAHTRPIVNDKSSNVLVSHRKICVIFAIQTTNTGLEN